MKETLLNYIVCLYYICKNEIHGHYVDSCEITTIKNKKYKPGECTCLTKYVKNKIYYKLYDARLKDLGFEIPENLNESEENKCQPDYKNLDDYDIYNVSIININGITKIKLGDFRDFRIVLDIIVCCCSLTSNFNICNDCGVICDIINLMLGEINEKTERDALRSVFEYKHSPYLKENINKLNNSWRNALLCIFESCDILNSLKQKGIIDYYDYKMSMDIFLSLDEKII